MVLTCSVHSIFEVDRSPCFFFWRGDVSSQTTPWIATTLQQCSCSRRRESAQRGIREMFPGVRRGEQELPGHRTPLSSSTGCAAALPGMCATVVREKNADASRVAGAAAELGGQTGRGGKSIVPPAAPAPTCSGEKHAETAQRSLPAMSGCRWPQEFEKIKFTISSLNGNSRKNANGQNSFFAMEFQVRIFSLLDT